MAEYLPRPRIPYEMAMDLIRMKEREVDPFAVGIQSTGSVAGKLFETMAQQKARSQEKQDAFNKMVAEGVFSGKLTQAPVGPVAPGVPNIQELAQAMGQKWGGPNYIQAPKEKEQKQGYMKIGPKESAFARKMGVELPEGTELSSSDWLNFQVSAKKGFGKTEKDELFGKVIDYANDRLKEWAAVNVDATDDQRQSTYQKFIQEGYQSIGALKKGAPLAPKAVPPVEEKPGLMSRALKGGAGAVSKVLGVMSSPANAAQAGVRQAKVRMVTPQGREVMVLSDKVAEAESKGLRRK